METKQVTFEIEVDDDMDNLTLKEAFNFQFGIQSSISMDNPYCDLDRYDFLECVKPSNLRVS